MPLPAPNSEWPPKQLAPALGKIQEWSAWYSGNVDDLRSVYGSTGANYPANRPSQYRGGIVGAAARMLWGEPVPSGQADRRLHIPLAGDIAGASSKLLFGDPATFKVPDDAAGDRKATQKRLDKLAVASQPKCLAAADVAAGLGGVYLRGAWDTAAKRDPWMSVVHVDAAVPVFHYDELAEVTFWWVIEEDGNQTIRHLEHHTPGLIEHAVYVGTSDNLGQPASLSRYSATRDLLPAVPTRIDLLTAAFVPNLPSRSWRSKPTICHFGRSDYAGCEDGLDMLDRAWTYLMRDARLGKARAFLPDSMLQSGGPGQGAWFDEDREYLVGLNMLQRADAAGGMPISYAQPEIRVEAWLALATAIVRQVVTDAGYSAQTFGLPGEVSMTATESGNKREASLVTAGCKALYFTPALEHMAQVLLMLGNRLAGWGVGEDRPDVQIAEVAADAKVAAETVNLLSQAQAASIEMRVRRVNPDWDDDQVMAEVARIKDETSVVAAPEDLTADPSAFTDPQDTAPERD